MGQKGAKKRSEPKAAPLAWLPTPMLDGAPLLASASIMDFQGGTTGYVANVVG